MPRVARVNIKLWLDDNDTILLGAGQAELLHRVGELGSLKKAAESMNMSYRAAWGRMKRIEAALGLPLLAATGARRDGYQLTAEGSALVQAFRRWHEDVRRYALETASALPLLDIQNAVSHSAKETPPSRKT